MLVLGVGAAGAGAAAGDRIAQTLVGAGIGVLSNLLVPPRVNVPTAAEAIEGLAEDLAGLLDEAGDGLASDQAEGRGWPTGRRTGSGGPGSSRTTRRTSGPPCCARRRAAGSTCGRWGPPTRARGCARASRRSSTRASRCAACSATSTWWRAARRTTPRRSIPRCATAFGTVLHEMATVCASSGGSSVRRRRRATTRRTPTTWSPRSTRCTRPGPGSRNCSCQPARGPAAHRAPRVVRRHGRAAAA